MTCITQNIEEEKEVQDLLCHQLLKNYVHYSSTSEEEAESEASSSAEAGACKEKKGENVTKMRRQKATQSSLHSSQ